MENLMLAIKDAAKELEERGWNIYDGDNPEEFSEVIYAHVSKVLLLNPEVKASRIAALRAELSVLEK